MNDHPVYSKLAASIAAAPDAPAHRGWSWIPVADVAKLIRSALAKSFPGVKFYVRSDSYSGGSSIDIYFDGVVPNAWTRIDSDDKPYGPVVTDYALVDFRDGRWSPVKRDGMPSAKDVKRVVDPFAGGGFDGMIDLAYSVHGWLSPDGSASYGSSSGTVGSHGLDPAYDFPRPDPRAILVRFAADHVFVNDHLPYDVRVKGAA